MRNFVVPVLAVLLIASIATSAKAERTEWFEGKDRYEITKRLKGKLLLEIECRDSKTPGLHLARDEFRVTYTDNPTSKKFTWAIGNHYGRYKHWADKNGYKLVSINQYTRASGLKIRCAVWHKK
ncbi:MAG: hypothetical protein AAF423_13735 [Pseudomonadota bacterium]